MKCPEDQQSSFALHFQFQGRALAAPGSLRRLLRHLNFFHIETKAHVGHPGFHNFVALGVQCAFVTSRKLLVISCRGRVDPHTNSLGWYLLRITVNSENLPRSLFVFIIIIIIFFLRGLFLKGLIFGGAYLWKEICVSKSIGLAL